ncbi:hypothetical protein LTR16_000065 [Cryomyces antarcticus]|uniref:Uncharacterized protein n=1 Tax=Cryomyces antarcticus TaxID=329879 RepID=A0ABR0M9L4_9PEZI|nr:hypothetical protein LTR60_005309 [Cryomyces antarcticus]KAK5018680.1 hypothetical protein LTR39_000841 [Cryomyces antarcticus]KAK5297048.1 hypothetical protein LTR16_000065 [Cryomyces antarcticus]
MATPLQETVEFAQFVEKELSAKCAERDPDFASISALIAQYRTASEAIIFNNYSYAVANGIEVRFWAAHSKVNNRYRAQLSKVGRTERNTEDSSDGPDCDRFGREERPQLSTLESSPTPTSTLSKAAKDATAAS